MAFPGGRVDPGDPDRAAAERETLEEVGLAWPPPSRSDASTT
jgi:8-oxo-dGTP pyrophosphatase MutT (NUDIX family)